MTDPTAGAAQILGRTEPWVRVASFVALLLAGVTASLAFDAVLGGLVSHRFETAPFLLLYGLLTIVFLVPAFYLHKYARRIRLFVAQGHTVQLEAALDAQRKYWTFVGVMALLGFFALAVAAVLALV